MFSSNSSQVSSSAVFVEDVMSTYLYTGTGAALTITNGIDLSTKGGLVWVKNRSQSQDHFIQDTARTNSYFLASNLTNPATNGSVTATYNTTGFSFSGGTTYYSNSGDNYCSWTFRKQPKFFDVVTYTGTGSNTTIAHALGAVPGCIIVKRTDTAAAWAVYHRSLANTQYLVLNTTAAAATGATWWNSTTPTSSVFSVGTDASVNASGGTYVAYIFAHDAGGFGLAGTDNVISCGSYVGNGLTAGPQVTLGYEPQWVLRKNATAARGGPGTAGSWSLVDNMRGLSQTTCPFLFANESAAENTSTVTTGYIIPNATGFVDTYTYPGDTYIYIAIRRGPMKVPTLGTSVFSPQAVNVSAGTKITTGFPVDWQIDYYRSFAANYNSINFSRLTGVSSNGTDSGQCLWTAKTDAEATFAGTLGWDNTGYNQTGNLWPNIDNIYWNFGRAPSFFDEVCYTGTGVRPLQLSHNLGAVPELMIVKIRATAAQPWFVYSSALGNTQYLSLNTTAAFATSISAWSNTTPTSTTFTVGDFDAVNGSTNYTYVAYLFATCPGVSKVGSYTGNGTTQTIDCGFTGGARFVLIKRTDATGGWYVYDTARGMTTLTDPYLFLNTTAAEVATLGSVTTVATGFALNSSILAAINISAGTYIFLAIA